MAVHVFAMPDLGEGLVEGTVVRWLVAEGDEVGLDQPIAEVETEKALVEVPSPYAGVVVTLHAPEGAVVAVGDPLIGVETGRPATGADPSGADPSGADPSGADPSGGVLVGYGTGGTGPSWRRRGGGPPPDRPGAGDPAASGRPGSALATPAVRGLARELGVDLADVVGTGPGGTVTRDDVQRASSGGAPEGTGSGDIGATRRLPLSGVRRSTAERVSRSRREVPEVTTWVDVDATEVWERRRELQAAHPGRRVSALAFVLRACALGLQRYPVLNAHFDGDRQELVLFDEIHLGVATQTPRGLLMPVLRSARDRPVLDLAGEVERLADSARLGSIVPGELAGATFSVSNYGAFGVDGGTPIVHVPEVAILGVGRFVERPAAHRGEIALRRMVELALAFDHRACDGLEGAGFLRFVADCMEDPSALLA